MSTGNGTASDGLVGRELAACRARHTPKQARSIAAAQPWARHVVVEANKVDYDMES